MLGQESDTNDQVWEIRLRQGHFNSASDSNLFWPKEQLQGEDWEQEGSSYRKGGQTCSPLYEAKMFHQYDHRFGTYEDFTGSEFSPLPTPTLSSHRNPNFVVQSRYWLHDRERTARGLRRPWTLAFRGVVRNTDVRTGIAAILPDTNISDMAQIILGLKAAQAAFLLSTFNSFVFDYCLRNKTSSARLNFFVVRQLPVLNPLTCQLFSRSFSDWLIPVTLELTYTAWDLQPFAKDLEFNGPPFRWNEERRFLLRCELDAAYFHLYLGRREEWEQEPEELLQAFSTPRHTVDYIMETFPIVKRKDIKEYGEYRTKRTILSTGKPASLKLTQEEWRSFQVLAVAE